MAKESTYLTKIFRGEEISDAVVLAWLNEMSDKYSNGFELIGEPKLQGQSPTILMFYYSIPRVENIEVISVDDKERVTVLGGTRKRYVSSNGNKN